MSSAGKASPQVVAAQVESTPRMAPPASPQPIAAFEAPAPADVATAEPATQTAPSPGAQKFANASDMMASTFDTLNDLRARINGPNAVVAAAAINAAATQDPEPTAVAEAAPAPLPTPAPIATAMQSPTKRSVSLIKVMPDGSLQSPSAAAAAIEATHADVAPEATDVAVVAPDAAVAPLAFANAPEAVPQAEPRRRARVGDSLASVRAGPDKDEKRLFVLDIGEEVTAIATTGEWVQVEDTKGRSGWVLGELLTDAPAGLPVVEEPAAEETAALPEPVAEPEPPAKPEADVATGDTRTVLGQGVNVRSGPSTSSEKVFTLPPGRKVTVSDDSHGWLHITDEKGRTGWVYKDYVSG